jgi:microsomal dipeptidase-like Zn-dependent dipeptidase
MKTKILFVLLLANMVAKGQTTFRHIAVAANTTSHITILDHPLLNGNDRAVLFVSPIWEKKGDNSINHTFGVWYNGSRWTIFNQNRQPMLPATIEKFQFNVLIYEKLHANTFVQTVIANNKNAHITILDHPQLNGNPNAVLLVSQKYGVYNPHEIGVWYNGSRWTIFNQDRADLSLNTLFNVLIATDGVNIARSFVLQHTHTKASQLADTRYPSYTALNDSRLNSSNNWNLFVTQRYLSAYNPFPYTVWYDSPNDEYNFRNGNWLIYNGLNQAMPLNAGFNIVAVPKPFIPEFIPIPTTHVAPAGLNGWVDMHTHPMSYLGFGRKLMHGVLDVGSLIPAGTRTCNSSDYRARSIEEALGNCNSTHGGWGLENGCGNYIRAATISKAFDDDFIYNVDHNPFEGGNLHGDHQHAGIETSPNFRYWPHQSSKAHQQMWWEWIKRAHQEGGLRVMVALTVNSELFAKVLDGDNPIDDKATADLQIDELKLFVGRHSDFMEIAYSPVDLRRIVSANKLAVLIGMEVDNIGNFNKAGVVCNEGTVKAEIQRLYNKGVRYMFPIHIVDNAFGGTAVYEDLFNYANKYNSGSLFAIQSSETLDPSITGRMGSGLDNAGNLMVKLAVDALSEVPFPPAFNVEPGNHFCFPPKMGCWDKFKMISGLLAPDPLFAQYASIQGGHANAKGLTPIGEMAIKEMMRLGILIDIDHMSFKSAARTLEWAKVFQYPVNIGHNGIREVAGNERAAARQLVDKLADLGGMFGLGTSDSEKAHSDANSFINNFQSIWKVMGQKSVAMGTDVNGLERLPRVSQGLNAATFYQNFPPCRTGNRTWDYTTEGVAHYGLMADFVKDIQNRNPTVYNHLMKSAEYFAQMWEKCERQKTSVR